MDRDRTTRTGARAPGVERPASLARRCITESSSLTWIGAGCRATGCTKDGGTPCGGKGMPGAGFTKPPYGKAPSERPALKPYWGKPAVRNFRGDDGNVGIMRSPVRAIVLPGKSPCPDLARGRGGQWSCEKIQPGRRRGKNARKATWAGAIARVPARSGVVEDPRHA